MPCKRLAIKSRTNMRFLGSSAAVAACAAAASPPLLACMPMKDMEEKLHQLPCRRTFPHPIALP
eukprot:5660033-Amphidinium_carterae.1